MATINQIKKQIETSQKRINDYGKKIEMYYNRTEKAIANVNKTGLNISIDDIKEEISDCRFSRRDYSFDESIRKSISFDDAHRIINNYEYAKENEKNRLRELNSLVKLQSQLKSLEDAKRADAKSYNNGLESILEKSMAEFKTVWFEKMLTWYSEHYNHIMAVAPAANERHKRAMNLRLYFIRKYQSHRNICQYLEIVKKHCEEIIWDAANYFDTKEKYMYGNEQMLKCKWERGLKKLTKKCQTFDINESAIKITNPQMTSKGFEVVITDGKPRLIYARIIWAAEYSDCVAPHTRYIVTNRRK